MLAAIAWLVTEECDKNCFCVNGNWPSVKATTVYLNYLPSNKCSVPLYTRVAQQLGGQTTLLTGNNSSALSCTVVALRNVEHFGGNSHATSTHLQMYSWKSINGAYYVGQQQNISLLISCCCHQLAQEVRHKQSIWSRDCLFFHITQTAGNQKPMQFRTWAESVCFQCIFQ